MDIHTEENIQLVYYCCLLGYVLCDPDRYLRSTFQFEAG